MGITPFNNIKGPSLASPSINLITPTTTMQGVTITVTGGSNSDNAQMCTVLQGMMQNAGFTNVSVDPSSICQVIGSNDVVSAMRVLNPDLFDTPVQIEGMCEMDAIQPGSLSVYDTALWAPQPPVWGGNHPFFAGVPTAPLY